MGPRPSHQASRGTQAAAAPEDRSENRQHDEGRRVSLEAMKAVWTYSNSRGTARVALLALGDHMDADGRCFPSQTRLAAMVNTSVRRVRAALKRLEELGEIEILKHQGPHGVHVYRLSLPRTHSSGRTETSAPDDSAGGRHRGADENGHTPGRFRRSNRTVSSAKPSGTPREPPSSILPSRGAKKLEGPVPMPEEVRARLRGSHVGQLILQVADRQKANVLAEPQTSAEGEA